MSPGRQAAYQGKLSAAKEKALSAMGLEPTSEGLATVEKVFGRRGWESEGDYKLRLKDEMNSLVGDYERLGGEKGRFSQYNLGEGSKKTSSQQYSINDPKVIATAKKYGQTPEEVIRNLENARP